MYTENVNDLNIIEIKELDPDIIHPTFEQTMNGDPLKLGGDKIIIIAKPGSGKSKLLLSLLYDKHHCFSCAMIVSGTEDSTAFFSQNFPDIFIHEELEDPILEKYIDRQKISKDYIQHPWSVLVLDDCADDVKILNRKIFHKIFKNGRHYDTLFVLTLQYCLDIKPGIRTSIDGVFILREPILKIRKKLYENYASIIPTFDLFCKIMDAVTNDFTALFINNRTQSNNWQDSVFWYRAKEVPKDFKFGSDDYKKFHKTRYNQNYSKYKV